jgi:hypothetical protein
MPILSEALVAWTGVRKTSSVLGCVLLALVHVDPLHAEDCDAQCQAARKAQDPLAPITALLTDNAIGFGPTEDNTNYNFQLQPVHTFEGADANVIVRGIVPIVGAPNGVSYGWRTRVGRWPGLGRLRVSG